MPNYRRNCVPGGTFFFTVNLLERGNNDLLVRHIDLLREAVRDVCAKRPFEIVAWVVMPDHMHAVWTLPPNDIDYAARWLAIKAIFSRRLSKGEFISDSRASRGERGIWQRRFWEHTIRDERDLENHVNYIHFNPVKHSHVSRAADWAHSSFHRYVRDGLLAVDWASDSTLNIPDN
jgi:putative transposase